MGKIKVNQIENHDANQVEMTAPFQLKSYTTAQRDALTSPQAGWTVFNSTTNKVNQYNGSAWEEVGLTLVDEDDFASDSATLVPSQQSVKAYVDANKGASIGLIIALGD